MLCAFVNFAIYGMQMNWTRSNALICLNVYLRLGKIKYICGNTEGTGLYDSWKCNCLVSSCAYTISWRSLGEHRIANEKNKVVYLMKLQFELLLNSLYISSFTASPYCLFLPCPYSTGQWITPVELLGRMTLLLRADRWHKDCRHRSIHWPILVLVTFYIDLCHWFASKQPNTGDK